jgi:hypothetical protein
MAYVCIYIYIIPKKIYHLYVANDMSQRLHSFIHMYVHVCVCVCVCVCECVCVSVDWRWYLSASIYMQQQKRALRS